MIIIGIILALVFRRGTTSTLVNEGRVVNAPVSGAVNSAPVNAPAEVKKVTLAEVKIASKELLVRNQVKNFVERFGSYSMESNFQNFKEVMPLSTPTVVAWLKSYPNTLKQKLPTGFESVTSRVLSQKVLSLSDTKAEIVASTQKEETIFNKMAVSYKDIKVNLVLINGQWLVDGAFWQD